MKAFCPICRTEMVERAHVLVCPRNDIGDCCYDPLNIPQDEVTATLNHTNTFSDTHSYVVPDTK